MTMKKLPLCRICLVENVRMYVVADKNLQEMYEKLTDIPLVTEDNRPMLACYFCYAKLKQSYRLQRKCLEAEKMFAQMLSMGYETKSLLNQDESEISGYIISPTVHVSIIDECQTEGDNIKQELLTGCEGQDNENQTESEHVFRVIKKVIIQPRHSESEDDVPLKDFKTEAEEEQEVPKKKLKPLETKFISTNRPSNAQLEGLVEFLEQNPGIAKGLLRTTLGKLETKRKWANIATTLNSLGGPNKTGQGWAKYWAEKKFALKKQYAELSASMRDTAGGTADILPALSALNSRFVAVMGGQEFATVPQPTKPTEAPVVMEDVVTVQEDTEMDSVQKKSPIPGTSHNDAIPASSTIPAPPTPLLSTAPRLQSTALPLQTTTPPLQSTAPPLQSTAPPLQSTAPPHKSTAPALQSTAPPLQSTATTFQSTAPPLQSIPPALQSTASALQSTAPPLQSTAPPLQRTAPPHQTTTPPLQSTAPPLQTTTPPLQSTAPSLQNTAPILQRTAPPLQRTAPPLQRTAPPHQTTAPPLQSTAPPIQSSTPPRPHRRRSLIPKPLDASMKQFADIEERRVEAELLTAQAFARFAEHIGNITNALMSIAKAISDVAKKMPNQ